ncbi:MAG TPA: glycosyltransferase family 39 protein [Candidatus Thermoplasmatota archaeon]|nr:glycosyltransferase family 39 protein [Candidatus Thermoplasmatota archaeon]
MDPDLLRHPIQHLTGFLSRWAGAVPEWVVLLTVVLAGLVEATPFLGILVPAHTAVFLIAFQWATVERDPTTLILACTVGGTFGDLVFFFLGRRFGLSFMERWPRLIRLDPDRRAKLEALFDTHGFKTILLARTQPVTRSFAPYAAGAARLSVFRFAPAVVLGSFLVSAVVVASGFLTGLGFRTLGKAVGESLVVAVVALLLLVALHVWLTRRLKVVSRTSLSLVLTALGSGVVAAWLTWRAWHGRTFGETAGWPHALAQFPPWVHTTGTVLSTLGDVHVLALAFLVLLVWQLARSQWRPAYATLAAGPGLLGLVLLLRWRIPRAGPAGLPPHFPLTGSFPNETAAMATALAGLAVWLWLRGDGWRLRAARGGVALATALVALAPLATGMAWPVDVVAGAALGLAWLCLCLIGETLAERLMDTSGIARGWIRATQARWTRAVAWLDAHVWGNPAALWALIALGALLRFVAPWQWAVGPDADRYSAMALGLERTGTFLMPWGDVYSPGTGPQPSHHFPPLYPLVLAGFFEVLGFSRDTLRVASIVLSFAALGVTYACTRDLYGHLRGLLATAVVAVSPVLVLTTDKAYSENLLLLLFVAAMWAILKAIEKPWYMVPAAVFAALGYLTKSSMGYFFVIAGLGGLAWRLHWRGVRVLRDPAYLAAIGIFGAAVAAWAWRNWRLFGSWETSSHLGAAYRNALAHPLDWALLLVFSFLFLFVLGYLVFLAVTPWLPALARTPKLATEQDSGLWLAIGLPLVLTTLIDAALWLYERDFYFHNVRYVSFAVVPLVWLLARNVRPSKATWAALLVCFAILVAGSAYYALPTVKLENRVSSAFGPLVQDGDSVTFVDTNDVYRYYFDLTGNGRRTLDVRYVTGAAAGNVTTDWVLVNGAGTGLPANYTLAIDKSTGPAPLGQRITVWRHT